MKWSEGLKRAMEIQHNLRQEVKIIPLRKVPAYVAGVDAGFFDNTVIGVACLYKYPELIPAEDSYAVTDVPFPYLPGFLSFREGPAIIKAIRKLKVKPDMLLFDGQGIAHPQGLGIASHIGVLLDVPSVGCAKSRLVGNYESPGIKKGQCSPLLYGSRVVGAVLRTRDNVRAVFVSPGHRIDLKGSIEIVLRCTTKYRLPEPLRRADHLSRKLKRGLQEWHQIKKGVEG